MIRNGYARHLAATAERARLVEQWQAYPGSVQYFLYALLRDHGLQAAQLASKAVEQFVSNQQQDLLTAEHAPEKKEERDDAPTS